MLLFESLDFISYQKDTIYMLESYDLETATFYFSVWNKKNKKEFYSQGIELLESENFFVERLYSMIENWDVVGIRQAEKQMSEPMLGGSVITGIRIVTTGKKIQVKCIHFKEFFDVGKDVEMH